MFQKRMRRQGRKGTVMFPVFLGLVSVILEPSFLLWGDPSMFVQSWRSLNSAGLFERVEGLKHSCKGRWGSKDHSERRVDAKGMGMRQGGQKSGNVGGGVQVLQVVLCSF
jgi:hypothetical protein